MLNIHIVIYTNTQYFIEHILHRLKLREMMGKLFFLVIY